MGDKYTDILDWVDRFIESELFVATCLYAYRKEDSVENRFLQQFDIQCKSMMFHMKSQDACGHRVRLEIDQLHKLVKDYLKYCDELDIKFE